LRPGQERDRKAGSRRERAELADNDCPVGGPGRRLHDVPQEAGEATASRTWPAASEAEAAQEKDRVNCPALAQKRNRPPGRCQAWATKDSTSIKMPSTSGRGPVAAN